MAGEQQHCGHPGHPGHPGDLVVTESPVLGSDQVADHILIAGPALTRDELAHVADEPAERGGCGGPVGQSGRPGRPCPEKLAVGIGHAEQFADHQHG